MTLQTPCQLVNLFLSQSHKAGIYSTLPLVQERSKVGCIGMPADKNQQRHTARTSAADCCLQMYEPCVSILYHRPAIAYSSADGRGEHPTSYSRLSPKIAFLISFSCSNTKRATMALSNAVEGSFTLVADLRRSRTPLRSESM